MAESEGVQNELPFEPVDTSQTDVGAEQSDLGTSESAAPEPNKRMSVRESIQDAIKQASKPPEPKETKPSAKRAAAPGQKSGDKGSPPPAGTAQTAAPTSWSKEEQTIWPTLSPAAQKAVLRTEENARKGVENLKAQHQELDNAIKPYDETIKRFGFSRSQAVDQLFKWQMALAGPDKIRAFVALLNSHGVDPSTFAAAITGGAAPNHQPQLPPQFHQELEGIKSRLGQYDAQFAQQTRQTAEQTVTAWAKDKPHYDAVKVLMGQLIQSGAAKPSDDDPFGLESAYQMAVHANPETRGIVAGEQREKEAAERKAIAEKARKAGSSMRTGAPVPPVAPQVNGRDHRNETVRDSIKRALADLRQ